ncbi:MAG: cell division protein FtsW [Planctomycetota bacterium]|jgi:cell division protein FtsW
MTATSTSRRTRAANAPGQLTFSGFFDGLARKAEVEDPLRPATRLFLVVCALMGIGLIVQASHAATTQSPQDFMAEVKSQVIFRVAALAVMLCAFRLGPYRLRPLVPHLVAACAVMLVLCFVQPFAVYRNGSHRWVSLGVFSFQPSELARIAVVLWVADRCVRLGHLVHHIRRGVLPMLALALGFFFLILVETDLGASLLLLICVLSTMWVGGARLLPVGAMMVGIGGGAIALSSIWVPYIGNRIAMFMGDVQNDQVTSTFQALSSGGQFGAGLTRGEFRNNGVPYLESDYVFALVGEELGLFGNFLVLGLYCAFLWFSLRLVLSLRDRYLALVAFGLLLSVALQAMIHVQVVSGLAPPKGMTLPFLSDGGTSLVVSSLAVGIALGAARRGHQEL